MLPMRTILHPTDFSEHSKAAFQVVGALVRDWVREKSQAGEPTELYDDLLKCVEPALLDEVLRQTNNNRVAASRRLGLARATLRKLITRYRAPEEADEEDNGAAGFRP